MVLHGQSHKAHAQRSLLRVLLSPSLTFSHLLTPSHPFSLPLSPRRRRRHPPPPPPAATAHRREGPSAPGRGARLERWHVAPADDMRVCRMQGWGGSMRRVLGTQLAVRAALLAGDRCV
eukprot:6206424-Pleurochrysis_carterae.AAC.2